MTKNEVVFFRVLHEAVGDLYYIFPQIHLSAILDHELYGQNWKGAFSHINGKSVDFVLCEPYHLTPVAAIELDDKTHDKEDRKIRDAEVERMLAEARIPMIRFVNPSKLIPSSVRKRILDTLQA